MTNATATETHTGTPMKIYGKVGCSRAYAIRDFLQRNDVPFEWIEREVRNHARRRGRRARVTGEGSLAAHPSE